MSIFKEFWTQLQNTFFEEQLLVASSTGCFQSEENERDILLTISIHLLFLTSALTLHRLSLGSFVFPGNHSHLIQLYKTSSDNL